MSLLLSLMLFGSGCASTSVISPCSWVRVISVSKDDVLTDQTAREILAHNEKVEAVCK
jgi:hypothetical protein